MYIGVDVQYQYSPQIVMKLGVSRQIFEKSSNTKFHENSSRWNRLFHADSQTDGQT